MAGNISPEYPSSSDKKGAGELKIVNALKTAVSGLNAILNSENKVDSSVFSGITNSQLKESKFTWYTPKYIAAEQSKTSTSFVTLETADEIKEVVVPENGIVVIKYSALVKNSVAKSLKAALFFNSEQLKSYPAGGAPAVQESSAFELESTTNWGMILTANSGMEAVTNFAGSSSLVTTGMVSPSGYGPCFVDRLAPNTYNVSVKFKSTSGSITAKERLLQVGVLG